MKRFSLKYTVIPVLALVVFLAVGLSIVLGQNSPQASAPPRRLQGTLPQISASAAPSASSSMSSLATQNQSPPSQLPPFVRQNNSPPVPLPPQTTGQMIQPVTNSSSAQNVQLAVRQFDENAPNKNQILLVQAEQLKNESATNNTSSNATTLQLLPSENQPASAQFRLPLHSPNNALTPGASSGALALNLADDSQVPEHIVQGVTQLQEENQQIDAPQNRNISNQTSANEIAAPQFSLPDIPSAEQTPAMPPYRSVNPTSENKIVPPNRVMNDFPDTANNPLLRNDPPSMQPAAPNEPYSRNNIQGFESQLDDAIIGPKDSLTNSPHSFEPEGFGLPGPKEITGAQQPQLVIEKIMPSEVQIHEITPIRIVVRNTGLAVAKNVILSDRLPKGAKFSDAGQSGKQSENGDVVWDAGDVGINEEKTVDYRIIPLTEGEIGSVVTATFSVEASASMRVTQPALKMEVKTNETEHLVGGELVLEIRLSNPGTGVARNITIEEYVPDGLSHPKGKELRSSFGDLQPGESKRLKLTLNCNRAGEMTNYLIAKAENGLIEESKIPISVLAPGLTLGIEGPKNRYLDRQATYELSISNPGSAAARNVKLIVQLPKGLKFVQTDSRGAYDSETHTVHWALEQLPSQQSGTIELVTLPQTIGEHKINFIGRDSSGLQASASHEVSVDGIASLSFEIMKKVDPVELGREAVYEIRVQNQGSKASSNISLRAELPQDMRFVSADGPSQYRVSQSTIIFDNLSQLPPKEEKIYTIKTQCLAVGDQRIVVRVQSDELERPVTKEENTKVYGDEQ
ncbi:MAG: DUF11 domain-containing protein [Planctomycetaceae bacterium]|jgi:uncharacterized repeat protein (TIGR01451 family)|nr:DUF11 domain-containing protein [Planctomycetaceae bacterium]